MCRTLSGFVFFLLLFLIFDGYYVAYKLIVLLYISFMFFEMKFIYGHSCVMFIMKSTRYVMTR